MAGTACGRWGTWGRVPIAYSPFHHIQDLRKTRIWIIDWAKRPLWLWHKYLQSVSQLEERSAGGVAAWQLMALGTLGKYFPCQLQIACSGITSSSDVAKTPHDQRTNHLSYQSPSLARVAPVFHSFFIENLAISWLLTLFIWLIHPNFSFLDSKHDPCWCDFRSASFPRSFDCTVIFPPKSLRKSCLFHSFVPYHSLFQLSGSARY